MVASTVGTSVDWYDVLLNLGRDEAARQQAGRRHRDRRR
jgi:hypothetical protein